MALSTESGPLNAPTATIRKAPLRDSHSGPRTSARGCGAVRGLKSWENVPQIKSENTIVIRKGGTKCSLYLKDIFQVFHEELLMSNSQNHPQAGANEAPKAPAPGVATPAPQQNQGDKPATKPSEQQK